MKLQLRRFQEHLDGTPGVLHVPGLDWLPSTIERHWDGNQRYVSRVPAGAYDLVWHGSDKYPVSWALVNDGVAHYEGDNPSAKRFTCLLHPANWAYQLQGCVAVGYNHLTMAARGREAELAVTASLNTFETLKQILGRTATHTIEIVDPPR